MEARNLPAGPQRPSLSVMVLAGRAATDATPAAAEAEIERVECLKVATIMIEGEIDSAVWCSGGGG